MKEYIQNTAAYLGAGLVWCFDHWSTLAAFTLFVLQAIYQIYRIKKAKKECEE